MDERETFIYGVQPVLEALRAKKKIERIYIARERGEKTERLKVEAEKQGIRVSAISKDELTKKAGIANHQGVIAQISPQARGGDSSVEDILALAKDRGEAPLVLLL